MGWCTTIKNPSLFIVNYWETISRMNFMLSDCIVPVFLISLMIVLWSFTSSWKNNLKCPFFLYVVHIILLIHSGIKGVRLVFCHAILDLNVQTCNNIYILIFCTSSVSCCDFSYLLPLRIYYFLLFWLQKREFSLHLKNRVYSLSIFG